MSDVNLVHMSHTARSTCLKHKMNVFWENRLSLNWVLSNAVMVEASWNVMAHAQKPDFVFRRNGRVHLNRRGRQFSRLLAAEVCASGFIAGSNAGYTMFRGSEKGTGYPLHSPVSPSIPLPCVTVCHHISTGVYCTCLGTKSLRRMKDWRYWCRIFSPR